MTTTTNESELFEFLRTTRPFGLKPLSSREHILPLLGVAKRVSVSKKDATIFSAGERSDACYMVVSGEVDLLLPPSDPASSSLVVHTFRRGETFGELGLLEGAPRRASARARGAVELLALPREALPELPPRILGELYAYLGKRLTSLLLADTFYDRMDVLIVQDGGCAPGYNAVTSYLAESFERAGRRVFVALEGFKSLANDASSQFGCLLYDAGLRSMLGSVPRTYDADALRLRRGAAFRAERFPAFKTDASVRTRAARCLLRRDVRTVVCVGGNGTMKGVRALATATRAAAVTYSSSSSSAATPQFFFVPVTIDADVAGTETIGQHTGIERGAEKLRCYLADAHTHQRCYIKEMMGADGGFHALYSCVGAGAHYAALDTPLSPSELTRVAEAVSRRRSTVIVVAEGYARNLRRQLASNDGMITSTSGRPDQKDLVSASSFLHYQLKSTGKLRAGKKVVCEPFARDLRGASPNARDVLLAQQMAAMVCELSAKGETDAMPAVNAGRVSFVRFEKLRTSNAVDPETRRLADRL